MRKLYFRCADGIILYDSVRARELIDHGVSERRVFVALNSVDTRAYMDYATGFQAATRPNVLYIGRLIPEKKVDLLLRAYARFRSTNQAERSRLVIIGDGPERKSLEEQAAQLGIAKVVDFQGEITDPEFIAPLMNRAFVSVGPGVVGLSIVHSFSFGLPALVADKDNHGPEICAFGDGRNGLSFESGDSADLAAKLSKLWNDRALTTSMSAAAVATAREFSVEAMAESFLRAVNTVAAVGIR